MTKKKFIIKNDFLCYNLDWKILTNNSVTFRRWDGIKYKSIKEVH